MNVYANLPLKNHQLKDVFYVIMSLDVNNVPLIMFVSNAKKDMNLMKTKILVLNVDLIIAYIAKSMMYAQNANKPSLLMIKVNVYAPKPISDPMTLVYAQKKPHNMRKSAIFVLSQIVKFVMLMKNAKPVHSP